MAVPTYQRWRFFWGAADVEISTGGVYTSAERASLGASAAPADGIGARRAMLVFTRTPPGTIGDDSAVMHFDFLNITGGNPDDTWITSDYTSLETALTAWWTTTKPNVHTSHTLKEIRWYRIGNGVTPPNPPQRIFTMNSAGTGASNMVPPQVAASLTFKTGYRKSWGRTYLPGLTTSQVSGSGGTIPTSVVDVLAGAVNTLVSDAAAADFRLVVYSKHLSSLLNVESIQVDNLADVIRRRRWHTPTYRKSFP